MTIVSQRSFAAGEVSPDLYGRVDQVKYATGLRTCRNFIVMRHGGVTNRSGTKFVAEIADSTEVARLLEFVFSTTQTYVLEFGDSYMRVHKDGAQLREAAKTISSTTAANPVVVTTSGAHGYSTGDEVYIDDVATMTELNGRWFKVTNLTGTTFSLQLMDGTTNLDGSGFTAGTGGTSEKVYEIATDYAEADLPELHFVQSADVVTIVHPNYPPAELSRTGDTSWTLADITFAPTTDYPTTLGITTSGAGSDDVKYKVTAVDPVSGEESLPALTGAVTVTAISKANPATVTAAGHTFEEGDRVMLGNIVGMTEVNNRRFNVTNVSGNDFDLKDENSTAYSTFTSGQVFGEQIVVLNGTFPTTGKANDLSWTAVTGVNEYNIYRASDFNESYGFIGVAGKNEFKDQGEVAVRQEDTTNTPPVDRNPFFATGNYPSTVTIHQQRRIFANTDNNVEGVWTSRTGDFGNFSTRKPIQDDDPVTFSVDGRQVNEVQSMMDVNGTLIMLTVSGEWSIGGGVSGILTPSDINPRQYSFNGASKLQPILVNSSAIYVQNRENIVRDFNAQADFESYNGEDLTLFSAHLFEGKTIKAMAFQKVPHSVAWFVMSDGDVIGLTYLKEQELIGWHRHDFGGDVESVVVVPEGTEDAVYFIIERTINSKVVRFVERLQPRQVNDTDDYVFMDSSKTIDGTNTAATTMTVTGSGWTYTDDLTLTSSVAHFTAADVGTKQIHITDSAGTKARFKITAFTSTTVVTVRVLDADVPSTIQATALTTWGDAIKTVGELWHLEGESVSAYGDSYVVASPNNADYTAVTVTDGQATLDDFYVKITIGLPILADLETLDVDTSQSQSTAGRKSNSSRVIATVKDTVGLWAGSEPPSTDVIALNQSELTEFKYEEPEEQGVPISLVTENIQINHSSKWKEGGRVFIRQVEPLPASILSIHADGFFPFRG